MSLQILWNTLNLNTVTPILKKLHWLRIYYKLCHLTYKTLQIQQLTYLYNSLSFPSHSLSKYITIIRFIGSVHPICPNNSGWKGPFLSLLQDSGTPSHQTPATRYLFQHSAQKTSFQVSLPPWILSHPIHRTAYPDLILVFPLLLALSNDTWC